MTRVRISRHTSYTITEGENSFEVSFEPVDTNSVIVKIAEDGKTAHVGYLTHDDDTFDWYFDEYDVGQFFNIGDRRCKKYLHMCREEIEELVRENPGRVFWINKYEHSGVRYFRSSKALTVDNFAHNPGTAPEFVQGKPLIIPDQQWDVSTGVALFVVPDDVKDAEAYCDSQMEAFSDWCNGSIYGVCTSDYDKNEAGEWEETGRDSCWGYIGLKHAEESLAEAMK